MCIHSVVFDGFPVFTCDVIASHGDNMIFDVFFDTSFCYTHNINSRVGTLVVVYSRLGRTWSSYKIKRRTKIKLYKVLVLSVLV